MYVQKRQLVRLCEGKNLSAACDDLRGSYRLGAEGMGLGGL